MYTHRNSTKIRPVLLTLLLAVPAANATPILLGIGSFSSTASDKSGLLGTLESGVATNLLGGMGSGLAYAGNHTFLALPDRGPNALAYTGGSSVETDITGLSGEANLLADQGHPVGSLFLDIKALLNANGITDANIPSKLEGAAFGDDVTVGANTFHTLVLANDNDFTSVAGENNFSMIGYKDSDLGGSVYLPQSVATNPESETYSMLLAGLGSIGAIVRRRIISSH